MYSACTCKPIRAGGRADMDLWLAFFQKRGIRVIFLRRENPLVRYFAHSATTASTFDESKNVTLSCREAGIIDGRAVAQFSMFSRAKARAAALGMTTLSISYETLTQYDPHVFIMLYTFIGVKQAMKANDRYDLPRKVIFSDSSHVTLHSGTKHRKLPFYNYVQNHDELLTCLNSTKHKVLRICHLYENCTELHRVEILTTFSRAPSSANAFSMTSTAI